MLYMIVAYDLVMKTKRNRRDYRRFNKWLKIDGLMRLQYSIYYKRVGSMVNFLEEREKIYHHFHCEGQLMIFPESSVEFEKLKIYGKNPKVIINNKDTHKKVEKI